VVKIARLTRSLKHAWKQIEILRKRCQELTGGIPTGGNGESPKCQSAATPPVNDLSPGPLRAG
jgi:hypothetical protein